MIRRSTGLAAAALILSLVIHFFGINLTFSSGFDQVASDPESETVELGSSFDELADLAVEPVDPEPVEAVDPIEPEEQTPPNPQEVEVPTTEVLVASPNPQQTFAPDTGLTPPVSEDIEVSDTPESTDNQEPGEPDPSGGDQSVVADARLAPPVETTEETSAQPPVSIEAPLDTAPAEQTPVADPEPQNTLGPVPSAPQVTAPVGEVIAALPAETTPSVLADIAPSEDAEEQTTDAERESGAVTASVRPPARTREPFPEEQDTFGDESTAESEAAAARNLISPLTLYSRDGIDLFAGQRRESRTQGGGSTGGRGPGNADTTNYAGLVLVHLNRKPPIAVSARGWARVTFRINPDGTLASVDIIDGSGSSEIDRAAKSQVRLGEPFPRPPSGRTRMLTFVYRSN